MKKALLILIFLTLTPLNLAICLFLLKEINPSTSLKIINSFTSAPLFTSLPSPIGKVLGEFTVKDARPVIIKKFLEKYDSPLLPYSQKLLEMADKYGVDYRLILAIAQCESNLCKRSPPESYNCWGFENGKTKFLSWEQAFESVAKTLKERYLDQGLTTPEEIMPKYAPPSVEKGGPWAKCVNQFMEELEYGTFIK
ncbi:MAG: hypothetical protein ACPLKP_00570 [Microgenomates group bacterium]